MKKKPMTHGRNWISTARGETAFSRRKFHTLVFQGLHQVRVGIGDGRLEKADVTGLRLECALDFVLVDDFHLVDLAFVEVGLERRVRELGGARAVVVHEEEDEEGYQDQQGDECDPVVEIESGGIRFLVVAIIVVAHVPLPYFVLRV